METRRRFVAISAPDYSGMQCLGVFKDHRTAVGEVMDSVWDFKADYMDEGDIFEFGEFEEMDGEGGLVMTTKYKSADEEKMTYHYYYILFVDD